MDLSAGALIASLVASSIGFVLFRFGRREVRYPQLLVGLSMMIYPFFVSGATATWCVGGALVGGLLLALRLGG